MLSLKMKTLKIIFILGYVFWSGMFIYAFTEVMLRNTWVNLFEINEISPNKIEFIKLDANSSRIKYEFEYSGKTYFGKRDVLNEIIEKRLPVNKEKILVSYNTLFPRFNYLGQLELKSRGGTTGMLISSFFLLFLILIDLFTDKKKWLRIYGIEETRPAV